MYMCERVVCICAGQSNVYVQESHMHMHMTVSSLFRVAHVPDNLAHDCLAHRHSLSLHMAHDSLETVMCHVQRETVSHIDNLATVLRCTWHMTCIWHITAALHMADSLRAVFVDCMLIVCFYLEAFFV